MSPQSNRALALLLAGAVVVGACGTGSGAEVAPFEDIQGGEIIVEFDASATSAVLRVDTTIPVVCAVVYGTSDAFGLIATDDDMRGGAHADHAPRLAGLAPETEYIYRLQGTGADGTLYQSEVMRFSTPAAAEAETPGDNVAIGATVTAVSSEFSADFAAVNALDGNPATEWSSAGDGDDAFIEIDLGASYDIVAVAFRTRSMSDGSAVTTSFTVTVDAGETFGPFPVDVGRIAELEAPGQVVRFDVAESTGGNTGAVEVAVYAVEG